MLSGEKLSGKKIYEDDSQLVIRNRYGDMELEKSDIQSITEDLSVTDNKGILKGDYRRPTGIFGLFSGQPFDKDSEFSLGEELLIDHFTDPTGHTLKRGDLYISGLSFDKNMANVVKEAKVPVVLMNNQSTQGRTNRAKENFKSLQRLMDTAIECGIDSDKIILDPGIGFSKSVEENLEIINSLEIFQQLQHPILLGPSRKNTIQAILGPSNPKNRFEGTAALSVIAITKGVDILRVHDIEQLNKVSRMADAVIREPLANNAF